MWNGEDGAPPFFSPSFTNHPAPTHYAHQDDTDELILSTTVGVIGAILFALCEEAKCNKPSETRILVGDLYGKLSVCLDELMPGGILESMDPSAVLAMSKLKPCTTTTSTTTSST
jgi:hypothetical protein